MAKRKSQTHDAGASKKNSRQGLAQVSKEKQNEIKSPFKKQKTEKKADTSLLSIQQNASLSKKQLKKLKQAKQLNSSLNQSQTSITSNSKKKIKKKVPKAHSPPPPVLQFSVTDDEDEAEDIVIEPIQDVLSENEHEKAEQEIDLLEIPKEDLEALLTSISNLLPEKDILSNRLRVKRLDWEKVTFKDYSADKCKKVWDMIMKKQRQARTTSELVADAKIWLKTPWRSAKNKNAKHPDFPKRPKSAFLVFLEDIRPSIIREQKDIRITEIARIAGQKYKELPEAEKKDFVHRAALEMAKFEANVEQFYIKYPHLKVEPVQHYVGPKKPRTPFVLFFEDHMEKEDHVADKVAFKAASKGVWNNMSNKKKMPWIKKASAEYKQYLEEVEVHNIAHKNEPIKPMKTILTKEELQFLDEAEGKPSKPPATAYMFYIQQMSKNEDFSHMGSKERVKAIAAQWSTLDKESKKPYEKKLQQMQENYEIAFESYLMKLPKEERLKAELEKEKNSNKERQRKDKRLSLSKKEVSMTALPKFWNIMEESDKETYMKALSKVRNYYDEKLNASMQVDQTMKVEGNENDDDSEEEEDDEESETEAKHVAEEESESDSE